MVIGVAILLGWTVYPALQAQYRASRQYSGLKAEYSSLKKRNDQLRADVADLKTPEGVERAARETLGLARQGENVYVVMPADGPTGTAIPEPVDPTQPISAPKASDPLTVVLDVLFGVAR